MKRNDLHRSLKKIKKELDSSYKTVGYTEPTEKELAPIFCTCKDAQGYSKMLYPTQKEAQKELAYLKRSDLRIYPCPSENGWHLTKN